jgi:hypothetical protein
MFILFLLYSSNLSNIGVIFNSFAICVFVLQSIQVHPAVLLMYFSSYKYVSNCEWLPRQGLFEFPDLTSLDFYLWGWMKSRVYKRKVDARDELFAGILDAAACIKKRADPHRRKTKRSSNTSC